MISIVSSNNFIKIIKIFANGKSSSISEKYPNHRIPVYRVYRFKSVIMDSTGKGKNSYNEGGGIWNYRYNWLDFSLELFLLVLLIWLFIVFAKQSRIYRLWRIASIFAFVYIGLSLCLMLSSISCFASDTRFFRLFVYYEGVAHGYLTHYLIVAFIFIVAQIPRNTFSFSAGFSYIVIQSFSFLWAMSQFIFWLCNNIFHEFRAYSIFSRFFDTQFYWMTVSPLIYRTLFLIVNISLLLFLFGLSKHPLPASRNLAVQEMGNAENAQLPNPNL